MRSQNSSLCQVIKSFDRYKVGIQSESSNNNTKIRKQWN